MKALELAKRLENPEEYDDDAIDGAASELRRLAEVNAELLGAINAVNVSAVSIHPGEFAVNAHALLALLDASAKAKEQQ